MLKPFITFVMFAFAHSQDPSPSPTLEPTSTPIPEPTLCVTFGTYALGSSCETSVLTTHMAKAKDTCTVAGSNSIQLTAPNIYTIYSDTTCTTVAAAGTIIENTCLSTTVFDLFFGPLLECPPALGPGIPFYRECYSYLPPAIPTVLVDYNAPAGNTILRPIVKNFPKGGAIIAYNHNNFGTQDQKALCIKADDVINGETTCYPSNLQVGSWTMPNHGYEFTYTDNGYGLTYPAADPLAYGNSDILNSAIYIFAYPPVPWFSAQCRTLATYW